MSSPKTVPRPAEDAGQKIAGVWSKSASSPWGLSPGAMATNAGYYKGQYNFGADGSYSFKGESWGGYLRSNEFWTIVESGVYSVEGDALTITPKSSTATLRNREGVVSKTQNNQLEKMTYRWKLHYFEGIREMNLVLVPTRPTTRDGSLGGNSAFRTRTSTARTRTLNGDSSLARGLTNLTAADSSNPRSEPAAVKRAERQTKTNAEQNPLFQPHPTPLISER